MLNEQHFLNERTHVYLNEHITLLHWSTHSGSTCSLVSLCYSAGLESGQGQLRTIQPFSVPPNILNK